MNKKGNNALAGAWVFYHWGCGFGIRNEHHTLYFTMIYVCLFNNNYWYRHDQVNIQKNKPCNVSTSAFKALIVSSALLPALCFFSRRSSF